jgi:hypothetical protein
MNTEATAKAQIPDEGGGDDGEARGFTRLTDRDRELLAVLALTRYLTADQLHRLFFDGHSERLVYSRLTKLTFPKGQAPYLQRLVARPHGGQEFSVWKPTTHALPAASLKTSQIRELPVHVVSSDHLQHEVQLNELFVSLWYTPGQPARARHPAFRWIPSDALKLNYGEYEIHEGRRFEKYIRPDAMLEMPSVQRRFFLECEMGTNPIVPKGPNKPDATLNKVARYQKYIRGEYGDGSHYKRQYPDGFAAEALFLVLTPGRAKSVNAALDAWRAKTTQRMSVLALTFDEAAAQLRALAGLPALPTAAARPSGVGSRESSGPKFEGAKMGVPTESPLLTDEETRLLVRFAEEAMASIHAARVAIRQLAPELRQQARLGEPPYPKGLREVEAIIGRAREAGGR